MRERFASQRPNADLPELLAILEARRRDRADGRTGWYSITAQANGDAEIYIYDEIGFWGITASDFVRELNDITGNIDLRINSPGGDVFDGITIYNALRRRDRHVNVFVDGIAASAASFIAMAGDTVTMSPHSQMMIHDAQGLVIGDAAEMRKMADILDKSSDNIASIYAERAGGTTEEWRARMIEETWLSDAEAVALGLADGIASEAAEGDNILATDGAAIAEAAARVIASVATDVTSHTHDDPTDDPRAPEAPKRESLADQFDRLVETGNPLDRVPVETR